LQLAQAAHAAFQLSVNHPEAVDRWHAESNFLVVLSHPDPLSLSGDFVVEVVTEPDLPGDPVTAVAFLPHPGVGRALSSLPLALREPSMS
jgi:hypothetical protein